MKVKEPKNLGIKVGTKDQVLWERVKTEAEQLIKQSQDNLKVQSAMLEMAETKIKQEEELIKNGK